MFVITAIQLSFDPFFSIVASLKAMQRVKLRVYALFSYGCAFVIASLSFVTLRFVLRELSEKVRLIY